MTNLRPREMAPTSRSLPAAGPRSMRSTRQHLRQGRSDEGAPGPRPEYGAPYLWLLSSVDPDGNKIEATFWDAELAAG